MVKMRSSEVEPKGFKRYYDSFWENLGNLQYLLPGRYAARLREDPVPRLMTVGEKVGLNLIRLGVLAPPIMLTTLSVVTQNKGWLEAAFILETIEALSVVYVALSNVQKLYFADRSREMLFSMRAELVAQQAGEK